jgi:predicted dinucleotide-binding enzyme
MKIGMIGGGTVGQTLAEGLARLGHEVRLGVRETSAECLARPRGPAGSLADWTARTGLPVVTMAAAAAFGEVLFNVTKGEVSLAALDLAGQDNLAGKVLVDVANPLDFSQGMPPFLAAAYSGPTSLAEAIQAAHPAARVVKAFSTVAAPVMVNPGLIPGDHDLFIAGDDGGKALVRGLAEGFGWRHIVDLGDLRGARAMESILPVWVRLWQTTGSLFVNLHVARPAEGPA